MGKYISTKKFDNFSIAIRQWKAQHSHCQLLHGYSFEVKVWFESNEPEVDKQLDSMNWIVDFGSFKQQPEGNGLKDWLNDLLDHTMLIEKDDPYRDLFETMQMEGICKVHFMEKMVAEYLARFIMDKFNDTFSKIDANRCKVTKVEVFENNKNSGIYQE